MMQQQTDHFTYAAQAEHYVHGAQQQLQQQESYAQILHHPQQEHYAHGPTHYQIPQTFEEVRTLWMGDLQYWMDENYLCSCFAVTGEVRMHPSFHA